MGWEYRDTDCEQSCPYQPRCTAKSKEECEHYNNVPVEKRCRIGFLDGLVLILKAMEKGDGS